MFCMYCGKENGDDQNFCIYCGKELRKSEANASATQNYSNQSFDGQNNVYQNNSYQNNSYQNSAYPNNAPVSYQGYTQPKKYNLFSAYAEFFKRYADFKGRSTRSEYWYVTLMNSLIGIIMYIVIMCQLIPVIAKGTEPSPSSFVGVAIVYIIFFIYYLAILIPSLAICVRRLHDIGKSGWSYFVCLIPMVGSIILLVFFATDSQFGMNKYGPNPKGIGNNY